ncbi:MAG: SUV3 C-terminal domain-containing protein [Campylobacterota bacterium]|nr:SUV3 C-terminal domain-containing protein [Campylobacterota bacterium]
MESKANKKIKKYFDGDPYSVGIERVSLDTLNEMFLAIGISKTIESEKKALSFARNLYSNIQLKKRDDIVSFFANLDVIYKSDKPLEYGVELKLESFSNELNLTDDEKTQIYNLFKNKTPKNITLEKIEEKLKYIQADARKDFIEKECKVFFNPKRCFEFSASIKYDIFGVRFEKEEVLKTLVYEKNFFDKKDDLIIIIEDDKNNIIKARQEEIDAFLEKILLPNRYLTYEDITISLKNSPLKARHYPHIGDNLIKQIILDNSVSQNFKISGESCHLKKECYIKLPFLDVEFKYILDYHFHTDFLFSRIWFSGDLNFDEIMEELQKKKEELFFKNLQTTIDESKSYLSVLDVSEEEIYEMVYVNMLDRIIINLEITKNIHLRVLKKVVKRFKEDVEKVQREKILAKTIKEFKNLFGQARKMQRKLTLYIGETNSGKTYQAMQKLKKADTGYYLAPLRLLALESYEDLKDSSIEVSLITGEEEIFNEDATHISSTIEMLNFEVDVDVCVIDEVQMIGDADRGWAWANAIIGSPASEIIMTGSPNSKDAIIALAEYLGEELEIIEFEKKNSLNLLDSFTDGAMIEEATAIIAFSRKQVLKLRNKFSKFFPVSVVYGNLSPEVKREEARRFRDGETKILIATDSIAMGLNLPIKTILFWASSKFDGVRTRELLASEVVQISGRAGRYGLHKEGFVGALNDEVYQVIKDKLYTDIDAVAIPFKVRANKEHIKLIGEILKEESLESILKFFVKYMEFNGPFVAVSLDNMIKASRIIDKYELDLDMKFHLSCAPLSLNSPYIVKAYQKYIVALQKKEPITYKMPTINKDVTNSMNELLKVEDMVKEISLYLWLGYRFSDSFVDMQKAREARGILNRYIENSLRDN